MTERNYPEYHRHLQALLGRLGKEIPGPMAGFTQLHKQALADGALTAKVKELIALSIGIHARCDGCIAFHLRGARRAGATRPEVTEAIGVAILMGGGPSAIYGAQALEALEQFEAGQDG